MNIWAIEDGRLYRAFVPYSNNFINYCTNLNTTLLQSVPGNM
jgi:hypothetical protein